MRILIFSDIHGNYNSFKTFLKSLENKNYDIVIFCGDIIGYYYEHNKIFKLIKKKFFLKKFYFLRGNHDQLFLDIYNNKIKVNKKIVEKYGIVYDKITKKSKKLYKYLNLTKKKIEIKILEKKILICHGGPNLNLGEYIYPDSNLNKYKDLKYNYIILGNTHYKMDRVENKIRFINPGSLGQPRDGNKPSYVILDLEYEKVEFYTINYNIEQLKRTINKKKELNKYLYNILNRKEVKK